MQNPQLSSISNFIWNIADSVLRDHYVRGKYRDVILPMTVIRRLDAVLAPTKDEVLAVKERADNLGFNDAARAQLLTKAAGASFYNESPFTLAALAVSDNPQRLHDDFETYLNGFSANVRDHVLANFKFHNQIQDLHEARILGALIEKFVSPDINLGPNPVQDGDGNEIPGLDNHAMGTVFEDLVRRFNEENNEEAGEHWTPRDAVELMAGLVFEPIAGKLKSSTYTLYDGAVGTGGMLTVAEDEMQKIARDRGETFSTILYGQEINAETYAICIADMLIKGVDDAAENIIGPPDSSTLSSDRFNDRTFDFMLSNPPYGKNWSGDLRSMGGNKGFYDPRFVVSHDGDAEMSLKPRSSDGQMLFLANMVSKMKRDTPLGSRIAEVHNGSSLFTGDAGQGESNIRRWIIENDWLEAIVALPLNMFYNTGIATYIWVLTNRKEEHRKGYVQLIDATQWSVPLRKNLGQKNCEVSEQDRRRILKTIHDFEETEHSKIFRNEEFGYWKVTVERPLQIEDVDSNRAYTAKEIRELKANGVRSEYELPLIKKIHKGDVEPDMLRGLFPARIDDKRVVVEYEPDTNLRDTEQIPLTYEGGIKGFLKTEVLPYVRDGWAWYNPASVKVGYEISFTRHFYKPQPMRPLEEIMEDIRALERESEGLLGKLMAGTI